MTDRKHPGDTARIKGWAQIVVFLVVGGLLLLVAFLVKPPTVSEQEFLTSALANVAFVLLTVVIAWVVWTVLGGDPITNTLRDLTQRQQAIAQLVEDSSNTGVHRIAAASDVFKDSDRRQRLASAKQRVDIMGLTQLNWMQQADLTDDLVKLVRNGVHVRVMVMDPKNPCFDCLLSSPGVVDKDAIKIDLRSAIAKLRAIKEEIDKEVDSTAGLEAAGSFKFRTVQEGLIACVIDRVDEEMMVIDYLFSKLTSDSPALRIRGSGAGLFKVYAGEFDTLWRRNDPGTGAKA